MIKNLLITCVFLLFQGAVFAQRESLPSSVFEYKMIPFERSSSGAKKEYVDWRTLFFESFEVYLKTILSGTASPDEELVANSEKLVIVKEGKLGIEAKDVRSVLEERSVVLIPKETDVKFFSAEGDTVTYFVIQWTAQKGRGYPQRPEPVGVVEYFGYQSMEFRQNAKGGRRSIREAPSVSLKELEMHITTLREGEKSHDPHTHIDEEIILVLEGEVEEMINGTPYRLGPGSLIFLASMDPHGIRNAGNGNCEYYAIRFTPFD
jgi:quercetin dioxygenase-like cupin family protein